MQEACDAGASQGLTRIARIVKLHRHEVLSDELMLRAARLGDPDAMYDVANRATDAGDHETARHWYGSAVDREAGREWPIAQGVGFHLL